MRATRANRTHGRWTTGASAAAWLAVTVLLALSVQACGDGGAATATPTRTPTPAPSTASPTATPSPTGTPAISIEIVPAPIEDVELLIRESAPPQYALRIVSGLPDSCHTFHETRVERQETRIEVMVFNARQVGDVACVLVYGTHEQTVELGTDFESGTRYTVVVNGEERLDFTAQ